MKSIQLLSVMVIALLLAACVAVGQEASLDHVRAEAMLTSDQIEWAAAPDAVPPRAELAVLDGDPGAEEPFVVRLRMPDGYHMPAHSHPHAERVTVIEGTLHLAMGEQLAREHARALPAGSFVAIPAEHPHAVWAEGETVFQVTGVGPLELHYLDPADDPRAGHGDGPDHDAGAMPEHHGQAAHAAHDHEHGVVDFPVSCNEQARTHFETGLAHLHHMMYEQARPLFEAAAEADPDCAMAHWGIAMTSFQPLWHPTSEEGLARGKAAVETAQSLGAPTEREQGYIAAVAAFFADPEPHRDSRAADHEARVRSWMEAQRELHEAHPEDVDAAAFYALAEVCYAMTQVSPDQERDYTRERRAGALIEQYFDDHPEHPGLFHYLIHAYDSPELAPKAEEVARAYDQLAPETVHALHMPSHIFVRLGYWEETVDWNERSAAAALRVMDADAHASAHYAHALDYMMYGYLQLGDEAKAQETLERIEAMEQLYPAPFAGYNTAAPRARYYLEQQRWAEAAELEPRRPDVLPWEEYPAAEALIHYARGLGAARIGELDQAEAERDRIAELVTNLRNAGDLYWAYMTEALGQAVEAWVLYERGETTDALALMSSAADLEDSMDKHPTTPGEVLPVRELYGELLLREGRAEEARAAFEASLERTPDRRNALAGVERAEELD